LGSEIEPDRLGFGQSAEKELQKLIKIWRRDLGGLWLPLRARLFFPEGVDSGWRGAALLAPILSDWSDLRHFGSWSRILLNRKRGFPTENQPKTPVLRIPSACFMPVLPVT
jgi:hypothetical protein